MKFPETVTILGSTFDVCVEHIQKEGLVGEMDTIRRTIRLDPNVPYDTQLETFWHEIIHGMLNQGGYGSLLSEEKEEAIVQFLGVALLDFLSTNDALPVRE